MAPMRLLWAEEDVAIDAAGERHTGRASDREIGPAAPMMAGIAGTRDAPAPAGGVMQARGLSIQGDVPCPHESNPFASKPSNGSMADAAIAPSACGSNRHPSWACQFLH